MSNLYWLTALKSRNVLGKLGSDANRFFATIKKVVRPLLIESLKGHLKKRAARRRDVKEIAL